MQVMLAVHDLLRQIALTLPNVETPPELGAANLRSMVSAYKDKDRVSGPAGYTVAIGARDKGGHEGGHPSARTHPLVILVLTRT